MSAGSPELPDDVALKVSVGERETDDLEAALELLLTREDVRVEMGRAAAGLARREHDLEGVAERYAAALEEAVGGPAVADAVLRGGERGGGRRRDRAGDTGGLGPRRAPRRVELDG